LKCQRNEAAAGYLEALLNEEGLAVALMELPVAARGLFGLDAQPGKMVAGAGFGTYLQDSLGRWIDHVRRPGMPSGIGQGFAQGGAGVDVSESAAVMLWA
jgi:hypothetical protein